MIPYPPCWGHPHHLQPHHESSNKRDYIQLTLWAVQGCSTVNNAHWSWCYHYLFMWHMQIKCGHVDNTNTYMLSRDEMACAIDCGENSAIDWGEDGHHWDSYNTPFNLVPQWCQVTGTYMALVPQTQVMEALPRMEAVYTRGWVARVKGAWDSTQEP